MICFYHSRDLDGHCSGAIVRYKNPEEQCELIAMDYGDPFPWEKIKDEYVVMCDLSRPWEEMLRIQREAKTFVWIDHHRTAIEAESASAFAGTIKGQRHEGIGACELTWRYFFPGDEVPLVVHLLASYDVWEHADPRTLLVQSAINSYPTDPALGPSSMSYWEDIFDDEDTLLINDLLADGEAIRRNKIKWDAQVARESIFVLEWEGHTWLATNNGGNSQYFDSVINSVTCPKYDGLMLFRWRQGKWIISLYCDQTRESPIICGDIAKRYQGGTRVRAASAR